MLRYLFVVVEANAFSFRQDIASSLEYNIYPLVPTGVLSFPVLGMLGKIEYYQLKLGEYN